MHCIPLFLHEQRLSDTSLHTHQIIFKRFGGPASSSFMKGANDWSCNFDPQSNGLKSVSLRSLHTFNWWYALNPWKKTALGGGRRAGPICDLFDKSISSYLFFLICGSLSMDEYICSKKQILCIQYHLVTQSLHDICLQCFSALRSSVIENG